MRVADLQRPLFCAPPPAGTPSLRPTSYSPLPPDGCTLSRLLLWLLATFCSYHKQLQHTNVMVRRSTLHGLYEAMQRFQPNMPCVRRGLSRHCRAHGTCYDRFVFYMHLLGFHISFPPVPRNKGHNMSCVERCTHGKQVPSTNGWMPATSVCVMRMQLAGR